MNARILVRVPTRVVVERTLTVVLLNDIFRYEYSVQKLKETLVLFSVEAIVFTPKANYL